jgi:IclR family acetate operon transcriptional repressor
MQNVLNALRVLEEVAIRQPVGVSELSRALGMPKTSVQRAAQTLRAAGWLSPTGREPTRWVLTTRAFEVGRRAVGDLNLRSAALPVMEALRERTGETIHLNAYDEVTRRAILIERMETAKTVRVTLPLGNSSPLPASANGKAILACHPDSEIEDLLADGLVRYTEATIMDMAVLREELERVRARGYATNKGEWRDDIAAVAAAIIDERNRPVGSMSVSTPYGRMPDELLPVYGELVRQAAAEVSRALGHDSSQWSDA